MELNKKIGNKIKSLRTEKGFNQLKLSELLGVSRPTLSQIEKGDRVLTPSELLKLTKIFNVPAASFLNPELKDEIVFEQNEEATMQQPMRISVPQKNLKKFKEVLLYILNKVGAKPNIGETVIYKILFYIDFDYYEKYEEQLIGATYIKNHHGPTPKEFVKIVEQMEKNSEIFKVKNKYFDYPQTKYLPLREPDLTILSGQEKAHIDEVLNKLSDMNAAQASKYSHNDVPWLTTDEGKIISYESVFYRTAPYSVRKYSNDEQDI